jgi:hypothetical protein
MLAPPPERAAEPAGSPSIVNCTVPVGAKKSGTAAATVAVNVTESPSADGFSLEDTDVVVPA